MPPNIMPAKVSVRREIVSMLWEMIEECQREAYYATSAREREIYLAKRDALTEIRLRVRDGQRDPSWLHRPPPLTSIYGDRD